MERLQTFFPLVFDSTMLSDFNGCLMKGFRQYIQHLNGEESTDLIAGGAFAKGLEIARKGYYQQDLSSSAAVEIGKEACWEQYGDHIPFGNSVKTRDRMVNTIDEYFITYPMETDLIQPVRLENGEYGIEYSFAHPLPVLHPELNIPLIFVGRADMLCKYAGKLWVSDEKTTGSSITANWASQWQTRGQFSAYCWGLRKDGINVAGAYIRGISLLKASTKFVDAQTIRSEWETNNWYQQMLEKLQDIVDRYKSMKVVELEYAEAKPADAKLATHPANFWPQAFNEKCFSYFRPCQFQDSCKTPSSEGLLYMNSGEQNIWLPHKHRRQKLQEFLDELRAQGVKV